MPKNLDGDASARAEWYINRISLAPPPPNTSATTAAERAQLHDYTNLRTPATVAAIEAELTLVDYISGNYALRDNSRPHTRALLLHAWDEIGPVIFAFKHQFDRVRPSHLDPTLTTTIPVPGHPAYPSGHAADGHLFALLLGILDPDNRQLHEDEAAQVSRNRENAGVHYESDTQAGVHLAEQFLPLFLSRPHTQELLQAAKTEW